MRLPKSSIHRISRVVGLALAAMVLLFLSAAPTQALTFTVSNTNDSGAGSLRQAIANANANGGEHDTIVFNIPGAGVHTINVLTALPKITTLMTIDGTTQPGFSGTPIIELDGQFSPPETIGLEIDSVGNSTIKGLCIGRFWLAIEIAGPVGANTIIGNYIGVSPQGTTLRWNGGGIHI